MPKPSVQAIVMVSAVLATGVHNCGDAASAQGPQQGGLGSGGGLVSAPTATPPKASVDSDAALKQQIGLFNSGSYQQAAVSGYNLLRSDPKNSMARYYYAQTLYKLNRTADASSQFAECYKTSKDKTMKANCYQALKTLANLPGTTRVPGIGPADAGPSTSSNVPGSNSNMPGGSGNSGANSTVPGSNSGTSGANPNGSALPDISSSTPISEPPTDDPVLMQRKMQTLKEAQTQIEFKRKLMMADVQKAKDRAAEQMQGIQKYYERPIYVNGFIARIERYENPDYAKAEQRSQIELASRLEDLNAEFSRREAEIMADCKARTSSYDQATSGLRTQGKAGTSQIQLLPAQSNGYVRHFVNYDGSDPVSLKARPQGLSTGAPAKKVSKPISK